jgi:hypothetical protein
VSAEIYFHRGKEARANGRPRQHEDGRCSPESRTAFYAGWDDQDRTMRPAGNLTVEQRNANIQSLKDSVRTAIYGPK